MVEVISPGSVERDYSQKREEYWSLGVKEYWIVDTNLQQILGLRRNKNAWIQKTLGPQAICQSKLLPGFTLACQAILRRRASRRSDSRLILA